MSRWVAPTVIARSALPGSLMVMENLPLDAAQNAVSGVTGSDHHHHSRAHEAINLHAQRALTASEPLGVKLIAHAQIHALHTHELLPVNGGPHVLKGPDDIH